MVLLVLEDTGLSTNDQTNEIAPNMELEQPRDGEESDSDLEENDDQWGGYLPLSQNPNDGEPLYTLNNDSEDEDMSSTTPNWNTPGTSSNNNGKVPEPDKKDASTALVEEVWSKPVPKEVDIEMSPSKIDMVKEVMHNFFLPPEAIPSWAKNVPEEEWKEHLMKKLNLSSNRES